MAKLTRGKDSTELNTLRQAKVNTQVASKNKLQHKESEPNESTEPEHGSRRRSTAVLAELS